MAARARARAHARPALSIVVVVAFLCMSTRSCALKSQPEPAVAQTAMVATCTADFVVYDNCGTGNPSGVLINATDEEACCEVSG